jgi:hypothetical protein
MYNLGSNINIDVYILNKIDMLVTVILKICLIYTFDHFGFCEILTEIKPE